MAIFNEETTLSILNEKKTREEYARDKFKKRYNYVPSKENKDIGTITKDGKTYKVDMRKQKYDDKYYQMKNHNKSINKYLKDNNFIPSEENKNIGTITKNGKTISINKNDILYNINKNEHKKSTHAEINRSDGNIVLDKKFFNKKGSNHGERKDASLNHEIGHHKTLNPNYYDNDHDKDINNFAKDAKKYENVDKDSHSSVEEFMADRYAANKTSEKAVKRTIRDTYTKNKKDIKNNNEKSEYNKNTSSDYKSRSKALKDKNLRKYNI